MHVAINCHSFLLKQYTGIGRYTSSLVHSLSQVDRKNRYSLYVFKGPFDFNKTPPKVRARNFKVRVDWLKQGPAKFLRDIDIYHAPSFEMIQMRHTKVVVTVHDLIYKTFPEGHTQEAVEATDRQIKSFLPTASRIICTSQSTRDDLHKYFEVDRRRTCVVHQGVNRDIFYPVPASEKEQARMVVRSKGLIGPYLLFVGTIEPRKNLKGLLQAFRDLKAQNLFRGKLAIVGMAGWKSEGLEEYIDQLKIRQDIIFLGFVTNPELRYIYSEAEVFVFPSFYEGFGYPIVEAFSCGTPVITSNVSSCPEVAGDAAVIVDPYHPEDMVQGIRRLLDDASLRETLRQKGIKRARSFNNLQTAVRTLQVYREAYVQE